MQTLKKLEDFRKEKQNEITQFEMSEVVGGRNDVSLTHKDTSTMDSWNCADTDRQMFWEGNPCSEKFQIWHETP